MESVKVKIADLAVIKDEGELVTIGLGSCVGVVLYDAVAQVAGLAHILLYDSKQFVQTERNKVFNPAKFADTALPLLLQKMIELGADRRNVRAKIAGGSQLFNFDSVTPSVGEKNVEVVRRILQELQIPLLAEDTGGNYGRTVRVCAKTGRVIVSTVGRGEFEL